MSKPQINRPRIGFFDSGVGGLSILQSVRALVPEADYFYCSDNGNFPYGPRSEMEIIEFSLLAVERLVRHQTLDLLVVACNTASTIALPQLRLKHEFSVVGVVPAVKPAAAVSRSNVIGLLATPGTVSRSYTDELIANHASHCEVIKLGSSILVEISEKKIMGEDIDVHKIAEVVSLFKRSPEIDTVVLACTHFPLILEELRHCLPDIENWVDSGEAVARRVVNLLPDRLSSETDVVRGNCRAFFTKNTEQVRSLGRKLIEDQLINAWEILPNLP